MDVFLSQRTTVKDSNAEAQSGPDGFGPPGRNSRGQKKSKLPSAESGPFGPSVVIAAATRPFMVA